MCIDYNSLDNMHDDSAESEIFDCLNFENPKSFFMLAGAGSGKTRSLVNTLGYISSTYGNDFAKSNKKVAVITYTNAARDEILRRTKDTSIFLIATIHSFAWELIKPYTNDIKIWLEKELTAKIQETESKQSGPKVQITSKAYAQRERKIAKYKKRLEDLKTFNGFVYSPDGNNYEKNSLDHAEVIKIASNFVNTKMTFKNILLGRFPIILIDECQDTKEDLLLSLIDLQKQFPNSLIMGLFGDTMQRIYLDGIKDLKNSIPENWVFPEKEMNHRSQKRIVDLCNDIRVSIDGFKQKSRHEKSAGKVQVFLCQRGFESIETEKSVCEKMGVYANDAFWNDKNQIKFLTIEHDMAAKRLGFNTLFEPLYRVTSFKTSLLDGTLSVLKVFLNCVIPILDAHKCNNKFDIMKTIREKSSLYKALSQNNMIASNALEAIKNKVKQLLALWDDENDPTLSKVLNMLIKINLFDVPDNLRIISETTGIDSDEEDKETKLTAIEESLQAPFSEIYNYREYILGNAIFSTHQGVKGLEFPRVVVIIDDVEAEQFRIFSYDKAFGVKEKSDTDIRNEREGRETTLDRTLRLFYVTCSRAEDSLAIVYYVDDVETAKQTLLKNGWFQENEIETIVNS